MTRLDRDQVRADLLTAIDRHGHIARRLMCRAAGYSWDVAAPVLDALAVEGLYQPPRQPRPHQTGSAVAVAQAHGVSVRTVQRRRRLMREVSRG